MMLHYKTIRIKFSFLWLPAVVLLPWFHMTKITAFIFLILSLHEGSHMMVAALAHYKIETLTVYPFGFSADIPELGYGSIIKEICIISAGPLSQLMIPSIFRLLVDVGWISYNFYEYLYMINASVLVFNLLPIYPLDGGRLLQAFFHSIFRFRKAQLCTCMTSFALLLVLFFSQLMKGSSALVMQVFLLLQIYVCYRDITHMQVKFYHYRYLHPVHYPIIVNEKKDLFRARYNLMKMKQGYVGEEDWLGRHFVNDKKDSRNDS